MAFAIAAYKRPGQVFPHPDIPLLSKMLHGRGGFGWGVFLSIRWLHVSDVHECAREEFHREGMYDSIVKNVRDRSEKPDLIFFTGDLAFSGAKEEYDLLRQRFLDPLRTVVGSDCPIFTVPGNHDVDRTRVVNPRTWMADAAEERIFQQIDAKGRKKRADAILPRFENYRALERSLGAWGEDWLASERGTAYSLLEIDDRRLAIIGMNTAWLCHDNDDWGRLGAGRTMLEAALGQAANDAADLTIVLGHHPLAALTGEQHWSDGDAIRKQLEQANAVYLHGHLHQAGAQRAGDGIESLLAIQAPSGFQAGGNSIWRNGILWGKVDFDRAELVIEPLKWNHGNREYVFDSDAAPSRLRASQPDAFAYPLPGRKPAAAASAASVAAGPAVSPEGWQIVDAEQLRNITATRPSAEEMADWFDGSFPRWEVAAADGVQPRQIVDHLVRAFEAAHHTAPQPVVRLLTGAGGEEKSTALLQTVARLLSGSQDWRCLWRQSSAADLPGNWATLLPRVEGQAWIVAIDDAENIGAQLPDLLRGQGARTDIHLILAAREADWSLRGLHDGIWRGVASHLRMPLVGLDEEDARRIADGWKAWGPTAMGKFDGQTSEEAASILFESARTLSANKDEGTLLGALLMVREGEELRERVGRLMAPWASAPGVGGRSMLDIYAAIVAMHAENQLYLSRGVLAHALNCEERDLDSGPLRVLRREAMVDGGTTYVLTRHRRIAEVARDWLIESGYDVDQWYPELARAALLDYRNRRENPDIARWRHELARHFIDCGPPRWPLARAIAEALFNADPDDARRLNSYGSILRQTGKHADEWKLMRRYGPKFKRHRDVLYEWGVSAGLIGDYGLDAWLAARSLADDHQNPLDTTRCKLSLAGLGAAFRELAVKTGAAGFVQGRAACGRLGLRLLDLESKSRGFLEGHAKAAPLPHGQPESLERDIEIFAKAVVEAYYETDPENDGGMADEINEPEGYKYKMLAAFLADPAAH